MRPVISQAAHQLSLLQETLRGSLDQSALAVLREQVAALGLPGWIQWYQNHEEQVTAFLCSTPSEIRRSKKLQALQPLLTLAAWQRLKDAEPVLQALRDHNLCEQPAIHDGASWLAAAGLAYSQLLDEQPPTIDDHLWPYDPPDPFLSLPRTKE